MTDVNNWVGIALNFKNDLFRPSAYFHAINKSTVVKYSSIWLHQKAKQRQSAHPNKYPNRTDNMRASRWDAGMEQE